MTVEMAQTRAADAVSHNSCRRRRWVVVGVGGLMRDANLVVSVLTE